MYVNVILNFYTLTLCSVLEEMISIGLKAVRQLHEALDRRLMDENWVIEKPLSTFLQ